MEKSSDEEEMCASSSVQVIEVENFNKEDKLKINDEDEDEYAEEAMQTLPFEQRVEKESKVKENSNSNREKKLMNLLRQQKLAIRRLELAAKQRNNTHSSEWCQNCPSLQNVPIQKFASCAMSALILPIQRSIGFDSMLIRSAFERWKGGPAPTAEQALSKAARLKGLLSRSSAIAQKLKEEKDMLRVSAKKRHDQALAEIALLKEENRNLQSAIRAAALSSDFADDYEIQLQKAQTAAITEHRGIGERESSCVFGGGRVDQLENNIVELQAALSEEQHRKNALAQQFEARVAEMEAQLAEFRDDAREARQHSINIEQEKNLAVLAAKNATAEHVAQITDLKQELVLLTSFQVDMRSSIESQCSHQSNEETKKLKLELAKSVGELGIIKKEVVALKEQLSASEAKARSFRQLRTELNESQDTIKALRRALSAHENPMSENPHVLRHPQPKSEGHIEFSEEEVEQLTVTINEKIDDWFSELSHKLKSLDAQEQVSRKHIAVNSRQDAMREVWLLLLRCFASDFHDVETPFKHCRDKISEILSRLQLIGAENSTAMQRLVSEQSRFNTTSLHTKKLIKAATTVIDSGDPSQEFTEIRNALLPVISKAEADYDGLVFTSPLTRLKPGSVFDLPLPVANNKSILDWKLNVLDAEFNGQIEMVCFYGSAPPEGVDGVEVVSRRFIFQSNKEECGSVIAFSSGLHTLRLQYHKSWVGTDPELSLSYHITTSAYRQSQSSSDITDSRLLHEVDAVLDTEREKRRCSRDVAKSEYQEALTDYDKAVDVCSTTPRENKECPLVALRSDIANVSEHLHGLVCELQNEHQRRCKCQLKAVEDSIIIPDKLPNDQIDDLAIHDTSKPSSPSEAVVVASGISHVVKPGQVSLIRFHVPHSLEEHSEKVLIRWRASSHNPQLGFGVALCAQSSDGTMPQLSKLAMIHGASNTQPHENSIQVSLKTVPRVAFHSPTHLADTSLEAVEFSLVLSNEHSWLREQNISFRITMEGVDTGKLQPIRPRPIDRTDTKPPTERDEDSLSIQRRVRVLSPMDGLSLAMPLELGRNHSFHGASIRSKKPVSSFSNPTLNKIMETFQCHFTEQISSFNESRAQSQRSLSLGEIARTDMSLELADFEQLFREKTTLDSLRGMTFACQRCT